MESLAEKMLEWVKAYFLANNKMPVQADIANALGVSKYKIWETAKTLVAQGDMDMNYNKYSFSAKTMASMETKAAPEVPAPTPQEVSPEKQNPPKASTGFNMDEGLIIAAVRVVFLVIALFATALSAYYTYMWAVKYNPVIIAVLISATVVAFSVIAFEVMLLLWNKKQAYTDKKGKPKYKRPNAPIAGVFLVVWLIAMSFSMTSTVAGLYNRRVETQLSEVKKNSSSMYKKTQWDLYTEAKGTDVSDLTTKEQDYAIFHDTWLKTDRSTTNKAFKDMTKAEKDLKALREAIKKTTSEQIEFVKKQTNAGATTETAITIPTFYEWLSGVFKIAPDLIEFILSLFPALFIDIIAPLALAVSMFLKSDKEEIYAKNR